MTRTDYVNIALTTVIALAAAFQAWFAGLLWKLQQQIQDARKETAVYLALDLLESPNSRMARNVRVRFENASPVGVLLSHLVIVAKANGRTADLTKGHFRLTIGEYSSRDEIITGMIFEAAHSVAPENPSWQGSERHTVFITLTPHYLVAGKPQEGFAARYRLEYSGSNLFEITILLPSDPAGNW